MTSPATHAAAFPSAAQAGEGRNEPNAADRLLNALHQHGIEYFFANAGTDFASIIEGFARAFETGSPVPKPMAVPHENAAVAMAHGYYMITGRPQAVMVHTNVGTANTLNALIDASRDNVPLILMAGRTPLTEHNIPGARSAYIHWGQEMYDQAGMLREVVKWDYELRLPEQVEEVVARAYEIAMTEPRGPVYLSLPREVLAAAAAQIAQSPPRALPAATHPEPGLDRDAGGLAAPGGASADHHHRGRPLSRDRRDFGALRRALRRAGGQFRAALRQSAAFASDEFRPERDAAAGRGRSGDRARQRSAVGAGARAAGAGRAHRPHRRRPDFRALSDPQLPVRPVDRRRPGRGARGARKGTGPETAGRRQAPCRAAQGVGASARPRCASAGPTKPPRRARAAPSIIFGSRAASPRPPAPTASSSTNIRSASSTACANGPALSLPPARPADWAGASARRSAPRSRRRTGS